MHLPNPERDLLVLKLVQMFIKLHFNIFSLCLATFPASNMMDCKQREEDVTGLPGLAPLSSGTAAPFG